MRIAVVTCSRLPNFVTWEIPNVDDLFADDRQLIAAFAGMGADAVSVPWDDERVDWKAFDLVLIRSTWDYIDNREGFLSVLSQINQSARRLFNPLNAVRWNSDKSYLFDLTAWGVPTVPTLAASSQPAVALQDEALARGWSQVVLKPRVGAGAADVRRLPATEIEAALSQVAERQPGRDFLLQPLVESVITEGEWSFIYIDGAYSHALLKKPAPNDYRAHGIYGGSIEPARPPVDELRQAQAIVDKLPSDLLYARLDLVRLDDRLVIMELELIEPMLYFDTAPSSADRLARAALSRLG